MDEATARLAASPLLDGTGARLRRGRRDSRATRARFCYSLGPRFARQPRPATQASEWKRSRLRRSLRARGNAAGPDSRKLRLRSFVESLRDSTMVAFGSLRSPHLASSKARCSCFLGLDAEPSHFVTGLDPRPVWIARYARWQASDDELAAFGGS